MAALVKSDSIAEEVVQETFLRVWLNRDQLPGIEYPRSWIFSIASNLCFNFFRSQLREERRIRVVAGAGVPEPDVLEETERKEVREAIREAVHQLSGQRRLIWQLHREQGLKQAEIARQLGISLSTVKNTIAQSMELIRQHLRGKGFWIPLCLIQAIARNLL